MLMFHDILVPTAHVSSEGSGGTAHLRSHARAFTARTHEEGTQLETWSKLYTSGPTR